MTTEKFVVEDDQMLTFYTRMWELENRFRKGNLNPKFVSDALQKMIEGKDFPSVLKIWRTLHLGTGLKTSDDFHKAIVKANCKIKCGVDRIFEDENFINSISQSSGELDLCTMTTKEIIGRDGSHEEVYAGIKQMGGELLPAEAGPQLRLQYLNQSDDEVLFIAMEPFDGYYRDFLSAFSVYRNEYDELILALTAYHPDTKSQSFHRWVFYRPRTIQV